jgi:paraquat-inducible protein B
VDRAGTRIADAADRLGQGADRASALLDPNGTVVRDLQRALDELSRASASLRETADSDGPLLQQTEQTMRDLSSAARALRQLANSLDAQPESLLRGRKPDPALPVEKTP